MSATTRKSGAGRPRDPAKHAAILAAARDAFYARGFSAATIEDVAARAGVSKVTIYNRFTDKESLFEAVVRAETSRMAEASQVPPGQQRTLARRLNGFGQALLEFLFHPNHVALDRILAQEFVHMPELAVRFFNAGPGVCRQRLSEMLAQAAEQGELAIDDPKRAAEDLLSLWKGFADIELKFGLRRDFSPTALERQVAHGTDVFLRAYRP